MKMSAKIVAVVCVQPTYTPNLAAGWEKSVAGTFVLICSLLCSLPPSDFLMHSEICNFLRRTHSQCLTALIP